MYVAFWSTIEWSVTWILYFLIICYPINWELPLYLAEPMWTRLKQFGCKLLCFDCISRLHFLMLQALLWLPFGLKVHRNDTSVVLINNNFHCNKQKLFFLNDKNWTVFLTLLIGYFTCYFFANDNLEHININPNWMWGFDWHFTCKSKRENYHACPSFCNDLHESQWLYEMKCLETTF